MESYIPVLVGAVFTLMGGFFVSAGVSTRRSSRRFLATAVTTQAEVLDLRYRRSQPGRGRARSGYYVPLVRFSLPDDRIVEAQTAFGSNPPPARTGQVVPVRYDPEDPTRVELASGITQGGSIGIFFILFGAFFALVGLAVIAGYVAFVTFVDLP